MTNDLKGAEIIYNETKDIKTFGLRFFCYYAFKLFFLSSICICMFACLLVMVENCSHLCQILRFEYL